MKSEHYKEMQQYARDSGHYQATREFVKPAVSILDRMQTAPVSLTAEGKMSIQFEIDFNDINIWQNLLSAMKGLAK